MDVRPNNTFPRRYNFFEALILSFFSKSLYRDVALNWRSGTVGYLFLLLTLCWLAVFAGAWLVLNVIHQLKVNQSIAYVLKITPQIPVIRIINGTVTTPENRPYLIKDPNTQQVLAIIDTSGKYTDLDKGPAQFLLTKNAMIGSFGHQKKVETLASNLNMQVNPNQAPAAAETFQQYLKWHWLLLFPVFLIFSFLFRLFQAVVYALFGKVFTLMFNVPLTYGQVLRLSLVAITPVIIISTILTLANIEFPYQYLFNFVLAMAYLIYAILSNK